MSRYPANIITKSPATPTGPTTAGRAPGMWSLADAAYWTKQGLWPNANIQAPDTYFPYVSLLLSSTSLGNANNNLFVDSSGAFNPLGRAGNTTQGSFSPYSTNWSNYFDGDGDYLDLSDNAAFQFGSGDFTYETWVYPTKSYSTAGLIQQGLISWGVPNQFNNSYTLNLGIEPTSGVLAATVGTGFTLTGTTTIPLNTWTHVVLCRTSGTTSIFVNGIRDATTTTASTLTSSGGAILRIGGQWYANAAARQLGGYMSNVRIIKGAGPYNASSSTITVPTSPLTAISGTSLLTCQSNRFRDTSSNNFTITVAGNTSVTDFGPFSPAYPGAVYNQSDITNWSGYFDGSGDWLEVPSSNAFAYGTGDLTLECWLYKTSASSVSTGILENRSGGSGFIWYIDDAGATTGMMRIYDGTAFYNSNTVVPLNQWVHLVACRENGTLRYFVNGVAAGSMSWTTNLTSPTTLKIMRSNEATQYAGYTSNLRIVKGTAVYTSAFTPPTSPLTAISGTSLLTCQNAAFTDNSTNNFVITPFDNATVTGNSPFNTVGYWSNYFNGSSHLTAADNAAIQLGTGAFTVEGWFNIPSYAANQPLFDQRASGPSSNAFVIYVKTTGTLAFYSYSPGIDVTFNTVISTNAWNHFAFVRSGNTGTMYVNGVAQSTTIDLSAYNNTSSANRIMQSFDPSYATGYLSNFRIVKGTAVYTANFTPPTAPLTAISGTGLLTCQSSRFIDSSSNALTITVNGSPSVQSFDPFYTATVASNGGSLYLDGSGDYLTSPTSPAYDFRSSNFTIEGWFYFTNATANALQTLYSNYTSFSPAGSIFFGKHSNNSGYVTVWFSSYSTGGPLLAESTYPPNNAWTHYALVRNGNTFTLYRNGVATASSAAFTGAATAGSCPAFVGAAGDAVTSYNFPGYMSDFRITKSAVYTAAFTPPTAPLTPSANTTLLLNGMNAGIYDGTTINDLETVGNAQVSTVQSKFGGSSVYFDGSGDSGRIAVNQPALQFGTSNFTAEGWVYSTGGTGTYQHILTGGTSWTTGSGGIYWYYNGGSPTLGAAWNQIATNPAVNSGTLSINTWYHFALVRNGNTMTLYINGTSVSSISVTGVSLAFNNQSRTNIGGGGWDNDFAGYIDDLRVTNGIARYTSNFTPPTQAFPVY